MISVVIGDLSAQDLEGVVCPIRSDLAPLTVGARDVLLAAGQEVEERLRQMGVLPIGGGFITPAGLLPCSFLIHVVTASDDEPESTQSVQRALRNGLRRAVEWELTSLALPPLGAGVGHLDIEDSARVMVEILVNHLDEGHPPLELTIVVGGEYEAEVFRRLVDELTRERFPLRN
ncbi:MAG: macro domain-containing protein [Longimicrobiales bacterium]|nr:macro domain-containing protein [Longimicrobiales bacterium]